jgi:hypothetical protein
MGVATDITSTVEAVRGRREELGQILGEVKRAILASGSSPRWAEIRSGLHRLQLRFSEHLEVTEAPTGLHEEVLRRAPRLSGMVARLQREHRDIGKAIDDTMALLRADDLGPGRLAQAREGVEELLVSLERHRRLGATLVHEAYSVDIGSGD